MKNILITGANEGIGYHMVCQLLENGKNAAVIDLNTDQLESLKTQYPAQLLYAKGDVRDADFVISTAQHALEMFGSIDYAIHNACYCPFDGFEALDHNEYQRAFEVNYYGAVSLCRAVLPIMAKQKHGHVCFTSSTVGITGFPGISAYASTKGALESLIKCLRLEYLESGIRFHLIHPPLTRTRSAGPLPVPEAMKADPEQVGRGLAKRLDTNKFLICHSKALQFQMRMMYLMPLKMGSFLNQGIKKLMSGSARAL